MGLGYSDIPCLVLLSICMPLPLDFFVVGDSPRAAGLGLCRSNVKEGRPFVKKRCLFYITWLHRGFMALGSEKMVWFLNISFFCSHVLMFCVLTNEMCKARFNTLILLYKGCPIKGRLVMPVKFYFLFLKKKTSLQNPISIIHQNECIIRFCAY